jgi:hypothetical protein
MHLNREITKQTIIDATGIFFCFFFGLVVKKIEKTSERRNRTFNQEVRKKVGMNGLRLMTSNVKFNFAMRPASLATMSSAARKKNFFTDKSSHLVRLQLQIRIFSSISLTKMERLRGTVVLGKNKHENDENFKMVWSMQLAAL